MSEVETIRGILREVYNKENLPQIELVKMILNENNIEYDSNDEDNIRDIFFDKFYDDFILYKDKVFKVEKRKDLESEAVFEISENADGSYSFLVQYYNGGCSFSEAIECCLKKTKEK